MTQGAVAAFASAGLLLVLYFAFRALDKLEERARERRRSR